MAHAIRFHKTGGPEVLQWEGEETKKTSAAEWAKSASVSSGTILGS